MRRESRRCDATRDKSQPLADSAAFPGNGYFPLFLSFTITLRSALLMRV
jgi:hypothetical protein